MTVDLRSKQLKTAQNRPVPIGVGGINDIRLSGLSNKIKNQLNLIKNQDLNNTFRDIIELIEVASDDKQRIDQIRDNFEILWNRVSKLTAQEPNYTGQSSTANQTTIIGGSGSGSASPVSDKSLFVYDLSGSKAISNSETDIIYDTEIEDDGSFSHAAGSAIVDILSTGEYEIDFDATFESNVTDVVEIKIQKDTGSGYVDVPGSKSYTSYGNGSLSVSGDSGSSIIDILTQVFNIIGTANEIETSVSGNDLIIGLPNSVVIATLLTVNGSGISLGAGANLNGSGSSDIILNTDKFTVSGATGAIAGRGGLNLYSSEAGKTDWRMTFNLLDADSLRFYAYDEGLATIRPIQIGDSAVGGGVIFSPTSMTLGPGVNLIGSSTSNITINTSKFTVSGATGFTGINTASPGYELDVHGKIGFNGAHSSEVGRFSNTDTSNMAIFAVAQMAFYVANGGVRAMHIDSSGNVGINDSTPSYKLDVNGTGRFVGDLTGDGNIGIGRSPTTKLDIYSATDNIVIKATTDKVNGTSVVDLINDAGYWRMACHTNDTFHIKDGITGNIVFTLTDGAPANSIFVNVSGNVGINDNSPSYKLDVNGTGRFTGTLTTDSGRIKKTVRVTTTYTILTSDHVVFCNTNSGAFTVTLPPGSEGHTLKIINCGTNDLTVAPDGSELLDGVNSSKTFAKGVLDLVYNTTEGWW